MKSMAASTAIASSSSAPLALFDQRGNFARKRRCFLPVSCGSNGADHLSDSSGTNIVPFLRNPAPLSPLSKDAAMGLVLSAATGRGWTTGSGMEGPPVPADIDAAEQAPVRTFPWSLYTKSPRRRMLVAFTCNVCGQRTTRAINPHAYTDGTVFVQCCGCNVFHKLVDNLNLFDGMKCYVDSSFRYKGDAPFTYLDTDDDENIFPI